MDTLQIGLPPNVVAHQIGNDVYHIKLMNVSDCWEAVEDTIQFIAPIIGTLHDGENGLGDDVGLQIGTLISNNLKALNLINWSKRFLAGTTKNGEFLKVDELCGAEGLKVLKELVVVSYRKNCLDFLNGELAGMGLSLPSNIVLQ